MRPFYISHLSNEAWFDFGIATSQTVTFASRNCVVLGQQCISKCEIDGIMYTGSQLALSHCYYNGKLQPVQGYRCQIDFPPCRLLKLWFCSDFDDVMALPCPRYVRLLPNTITGNIDHVFVTLYQDQYVTFLPGPEYYKITNQYSYCTIM